MVGYTFEHPCQACSAYALFATRLDMNARRRECLNDGLVGWDQVIPSRPRKPNREGFSRTRHGRRVSREILEVHGLRRPRNRRGLLDEVHEGTRPAKIEMRAILVVPKMLS